jgi:hypothetical protein
MAEGENGVYINPDFEKTPKELLEAKIKNLKSELEIERNKMTNDSNPEMAQIYNKRISELMTQIAELESQID